MCAVYYLLCFAIPLCFSFFTDIVSIVTNALAKSKLKGVKLYKKPPKAHV